MFLTLKAISVWLFLTEKINSFHINTMSFLNYIANYFKGHNETWLLVPGHTLPISLSNVYNRIHVSWIYDKSYNQLEYFTTSDDKEQYKLSWLSASIHIKNKIATYTIHESSLDDFLETFKVKTIGSAVPTLNDIFKAWCAYSKHWFHGDTLIEFHIIDEMGMDRILTFNDTLTIKNRRIVALPTPTLEISQIITTHDNEAQTQ